ncbi:uncharacterized protein B0H18DRAFT_1120685 [Fomitopsis serialis]|uniref:uncharacterized protein n=1 Tax=Fomitopsis serialis TaxID=139415 RepID=UPI002007BFC0|nr:uncharacterized protein B0H18DRAFT_1120685 [Neoantrodia serialis]KAH9922977.1 hypothetical protein B0H18DRAFT_1120685 [Neoantrodia serialis]
MPPRPENNHNRFDNLRDYNLKPQVESQTWDSQVTLVEDAPSATASRRLPTHRQAATRAKVSITSHFEPGGALHSQTTETQWMDGISSTSNRASSPDGAHENNKKTANVQEEEEDEDQVSVHQDSDDRESTPDGDYISTIHTHLATNNWGIDIKLENLDLLEARLNDALAESAYHRMRAAALSFQVQQLTRALRTARNTLGRAPSVSDEDAREGHSGDGDAEDASGSEIPLKRSRKCM